MSSLPQEHWHTIAPDQMVEIGLVQVKLSYELGPARSSRDLAAVWDDFRHSFLEIAEVHGGKLLSWDGQDGSLMFLIENESSFDNCCQAAIQMLEMVPLINQDIRQSTDVTFPIEACFLCDTGKVSYHSEPMRAVGDFVDQCQEYCRDARAEGALIVTERVYCQLSPSLASRFVTARFAPELNVQLHSTLPVPRTTAPLASASETLSLSTSHGTSDTIEPVRQPAAVEQNAAPQPAAPQPATGRGARKLASAVHFVKRVPSWLTTLQKLGLLTLVAAIAAPFIHNAVERRLATSQALSSGPIGTWVAHAHKVLAKKGVTDTSLIEALQDFPSGDSPSGPNQLSRDQALAAWLRSEPPEVFDLLQKRLGIDQNFLGTGLSNTRNHAGRYQDAVVHEFLIPNESVESSQVWVRQFTFPDAQARMLKNDMTIGQLIAEEVEPSESPEKAKVKRTIIELMKADSHTPVIRFARLNLTNYKKSLGRPDAFRVFASDLSEVWKRKFKEAVDLSGYNSKRGNAFFIFVFLPADSDEAVPATWGEVLKNIPTWFQKGLEGGT